MTNPTKINQNPAVASSSPACSNPQANTPSACIDRYTVRARLAAASGVPNALPSATTEKLLMSLPDRLRSAKNPVRKMIVGVSTEVSPCR
jgi:hypothetical protein